jgi:protein-L-isoaspartate(D-aspartate) O-methyltransferase
MFYEIHNSNKELVDYLIKKGVLKTPQIIEAFLKIDRIDFVPIEFKNEAYNNYPLEIGEGQTISQPETVAFMLELLQPKFGEKVLDVGSGSGWTSNLLAYLVSNSSEKFDKNKKSGQVFGVEIKEKLYLFGIENSKKYDFISKGIIKFFCKDGSSGFKEYAPFNKILISASLQNENQVASFIDQLADNGSLVCPIGNSIYFFEKRKNEIFKKEFEGFIFVPLVNNL